MIIIADTHLSPTKGNIPEFFQMLDTFKKNNEDLVFLGDIFDLWIALPRYESDFHRKFLAWCREQRNHRIIGFIEGNHEFFVAEERKSLFHGALMLRSGGTKTETFLPMVTGSTVKTGIIFFSES